MDAEAAAILGEAIVNGARLIGAGLAMVGVVGGGIGIGVVGAGAVMGMSRNPDMVGTLQTNMILVIAFSEATAIFALVGFMLLLFAS